MIAIIFSTESFQLNNYVCGLDLESDPTLGGGPD
jgi:hypothetical protein